MTPNRHMTSQLRLPIGRAGFTLIEMLISIGLVVLMMSLFASIFQMASGSITTQRAIAENDQRARALVMLLRGDLDKRTFRNMTPFLPNENANDSPIRFGDRQGFFSVSEGDPNSDIDDVLQFSARSTITRTNRDETPYYGRAVLVIPPSERAAVTAPVATQVASRRIAFASNANQPEADDADIQENGTAISTAAQITYFMRETNLYRRVVLIREPLALAEGDAQPRRANGDDLFAYHSSGSNRLYSPHITAVGNPVTGNFYSDFDLSAVPDWESGSTTAGAKFIGIDDLSNESGTNSLGNPRNRFGHHSVSGLPREYIGTTFFGRFTHAETSSTSFGYPFGTLANGNNNPYQRPLTLSNGAVDQYSDGTRRSEDLVLSNVHSFDVELWDEVANGFVDIGHSAATGDLRSANRLNSGYGPPKSLGGTPPSFANMPTFDTWHPSANVPAADALPPYAPVIYTTASAPNGVYVDGTPTEYRVGDIVVPNDPTGVPSVFYECISIATGANTGFTSGVRPQERPGRVETDGAIEWRVHLNRKAIKAIRVTIRFIDPTSDQFRQVSIVHSLVD